MEICEGSKFGPMIEGPHFEEWSWKALEGPYRFPGDIIHYIPPLLHLYYDNVSYLSLFALHLRKSGREQKDKG